MTKPDLTDLRDTLALLDADIGATLDALHAFDPIAEPTQEIRRLSKRLVALRLYRMQQHRALLTALEKAGSR